jgi:hypothetical protein
MLALAYFPWLFLCVWFHSSVPFLFLFPDSTTDACRSVCYIATARLIANLTKHIRLSAGGGEDGELTEQEEAEQVEQHQENV